MAKGEKKDAIQDFKELQDHRYDPGFYTGGNINPLLSAKRPNKYGYFLIVFGAFVLFLSIMVPSADPIDARPVTMAFSVLVILAGLRLLKPRKATLKRKQ